MEVMTVIKGMKNDVRKARRASLQRRVHAIKLGINNIKGGYKMKRLLFGTILLALVLVFPIATMAMTRDGGNVRNDRNSPPRIAFAAAPEVVVIPGTYVYGVPDVDVDIFFYQGWWWRPWEGRWYRSQNYNSGWSHYSGTPSFHRSVPSGWRNDYRNRRWKGQQWDHQRIPYQKVQRNHSGWEKNKHWEKNNWGVHQDRKDQDRKDQDRRDKDRKDQDRGNDDRGNRR